MSYEAEAANAVVSQAVKLGFEGAEIMLKLTGAGAKHLAALLAALLKDEKKWAGATKLKRMFREGKPLRVIQIPFDKLKEFGETAKRHGVLFHGFKDVNDKGVCNVFIKAEDAALVNRVLASARIKAVEMAAINPTVREKDKAGPTQPEKAGSPSVPSSGETAGIEVGFPASVEGELRQIKNGRTRTGLSPEEAKAILADPGYLFQDAGRYRNYLEMQGRLCSYSDNNMKLILSQRPDATMVASRNHWRQIGRSINDDAAPISIMVPVPTEDGRTEFETGEVFDLSDTTGAVIPIPAAPKEGSEELSELVQVLEQSLPVPVLYDPAAEAAAYSPEKTAVVLPEGLTDIETFHVLAREKVHAELHAELGAGYSRRDAADIADSVACAVAAHCNLPTDRYSFEGVSKSAGAKTPEAMEKRLQTAMKSARSTIGAIGKGAGGAPLKIPKINIDVKGR